MPGWRAAPARCGAPTPTPTQPLRHPARHPHHPHPRRHQTPQVRLKEYEGALREYKRENAKFFEAKERYKAAIAGLEREVQVRRRGGVADQRGWLPPPPPPPPPPVHTHLPARRPALPSLRPLPTFFSRPQAKEGEKKQLLEMCNELMTRLEREGLSAS